MAEGNVYIDGIDPSIPQWSTEATLKEIKNILARENALTGDVSKKLDNVAKGERDALKVLRDTITINADKNKKAVDDLKSSTVKATDIEKKSLGVFGQISSALHDMVKNDKIQQELDARRNKLLEENLTKKYMQMGQSRENAELAAKIERAKTADDGISVGDFIPVFDGMEETLKKIGKIGSSVIIASEGINAFMDQGLADRFDLANEIRQSGLMAGFDAATAGLDNMSKMINQTGFTFGDAAAFVEKFSFAVGQVGVEKALKFANAMATEPLADGVNMMQKFGLNFTETVGLAGTYLDTLRNANLLGRMNEEQMRQGMDDFMEGVTSTSNTLKVSLEQAAEIIKNRLEDKQVTSMLALMDPDKADRTRTALANMGNIGEDSMFGQALIARLTAGSQSAFEARSPEAQALRELPGGIGLEMMPLIEQFASLVENTDANAGDFQTVVSNLGGQFQELMGGLRNREDIVALVQTSPELQALFDSLLKQMATAEDADEGTPGLSDPDKTQVARDELLRTSVVSIEQLMNAQTQTTANTQAKLLDTNDQLLENAVKLGENTAGIVSNIGTLSGTVSEMVRETANFSTAVGEFLTRGLATFGIGENANTAEQVAEGASENIANVENMQVGRDRLSERGGFLGFDNNAENMFDEIEAALKSKDPDSMKDVAEELSSLIGFNVYGDKFETNRADLQAALEAISTTDLAKAPGSQEKLEALIGAIQSLDANIYTANKRTSQEKVDQMTSENTNDRNMLIGEIRNLINAINNPGAN